MATGDFVPYTSFIDEILDGTQDWITDDHCLVRLTSSYTPSASHSTWADLSAAAVGTHIDMTGESVSTASGVTKLDASDATFSGAETCRYAAIVQSTVSGLASSSKLCGYVLLDDTPADVSLTTLAFSTGGIFRFSQGTSVAASTTTQFGLSDDQYNNQSLELCLIAQSSQIWQALSASNDDHERPTASTLVDEDTIHRWMDAGPNQFVCSDITGGTISPTWETGDGTSVSFDGSDNRLQFPDSTKQFTYLHDDSTDFTLICRIKFNEDISTLTSTRQIFNTYFGGSSRGMTFAAAASSGADDLVYGVIDIVGTYDYVGYASWSGFSTGTWYTICVQHTSGGATAIYIDDFSSSVASDTITSWESGDSGENATIAARPAGQQPTQCDIAALVICSEALTQSQIEDWDSTIQTLTGT